MYNFRYLFIIDSNGSQMATHLVVVNCSGALKTRDWKSRDWKTRDQQLKRIYINDNRIKTCMLQLHLHAVFASSESQRGHPQQQGLWCSHRLFDSDISSDEQQSDTDASTNAVPIVATVATPASDMNDSEVCLVVQRDARIALVPCGHQRFCGACANEVERQGPGCSVCRTDIQMILRHFWCLLAVHCVNGSLTSWLEWIWR